MSPAAPVRNVAADRTSPYGHTTAVCMRCRGPLEVRIETNGSWKLLDLVEPCARCTPAPVRIHVRRGPGETPDQEARRRERQRIKRAAVRSGSDAPPLDAICRGCGEKFFQPPKRGRPFSYCPSCRA